MLAVYGILICILVVDLIVSRRTFTQLSVPKTRAKAILNIGFIIQLLVWCVTYGVTSYVNAHEDLPGFDGCRLGHPYQWIIIVPCLLSIGLAITGLIIAGKSKYWGIFTLAILLMLGYTLSSLITLFALGSPCIH